MKPIREAIFGLIDITYHCGRNCVYCTRNDRHLGNLRYDMSRKKLIDALLSYRGFRGLIGIIGGEPLLHPDFAFTCGLIKLVYPDRMRMHLFTSIDPAKHKYSDLIQETFGHIAYHPHTKEQQASFYHQPLTIASRDAVKNEALRDALIDDCWVQRKWCPTITNDGAFFCEVGASIAKLMGRKGWPVEDYWWLRNPCDFGDQKDFCQYCGMCIPMPRQKMENTVQMISPSYLELLRSKGCPTGEYELMDREITVQEMIDAQPLWTPGVYKTEQLGEVGYPFSTLDLRKYL
jgi:hypothetical protein